jgi:hypothetical protein
MAAIHKKGRDHLEALREAHRAESERLLGVFGDVLSVVREAMTPAETPADSGGDTVVAGETPPAVVAPGTVQEVAERAGRLVLKTLEQSGGVDALASAHEAVSAHHATTGWTVQRSWLDCARSIPDQGWIKAARTCTLGAGQESAELGLQFS